MWRTLAVILTAVLVAGPAFAQGFVQGTVTTRLVSPPPRTEVTGPPGAQLTPGATILSVTPPPVTPPVPPTTGIVQPGAATQPTVPAPGFFSAGADTTLGTATRPGAAR